jgi:dUTP pyrophosphatase
VTPLFSLLPGVPEQYLPSRGTAQAAGCDLYAYLPDGPVKVPAWQIGFDPWKRPYLDAGPALPVRTGVRAHMRECHWGAIYGRSSLRKVGIISDPGVIDADYEGELIVLVRNLSGKPHTIKDGDRIAQFVVHARADAGYIVRELGAARAAGNAGGFGSTGA